MHADDPGISRLGPTGRFRYLDAQGHAVRDRATLDRIRSLVIPPAWTKVWICAQPNGHLQATGRDARGRKQYRYHTAFRAHRERDKFGRLLEFGSALPRIRTTVERDLAQKGLPRTKVLAAVVRLLELTHARIGNDEYARDNHSFGLTTLQSRHVDVIGSQVRFHFRGKSGKIHTLGVSDSRVARIVRRCEELPGQRLFEYADDDGKVHHVQSHDVNEYIRAAAGDDGFSAKDFRTLAGTVLAARALGERGPCASKTAMVRQVREALQVVADRLGNTVTVCRKSYVHPAVLEGYSRSLLSDGKATLRAEERAIFRLVKRVAPLFEAQLGGS